MPGTDGRSPLRGAATGDDDAAAGGASTRDEIARRRRLVDDHLLVFLSPGDCDAPPGLRAAIEYPLRSGGKRIRPVILLSAGLSVGGAEVDLLPFACAIEYVHTYSLVHDDLPAMDDDDFRRGHPACHKVFGEAAAILAGDALLTEAFRVMAESPLAAREPRRAVRAMALLARAAGAEGMVGGQELDIRSGTASRDAEGRDGGPGGKEEASETDEIAARKTGALIAASAAMGAVLAGGRDKQVDSLRRFGRALGILFQLTDDILDQTGSFEEMGKAVAKDRARGKRTWPALFGLEAAAARAAELTREAHAALAGFGPEAEPLREIARLVASRRS